MMQWMTKQKRYRQRMQEMGLCRECRSVAAVGSSRCRFHLEKLAAKARERRKTQVKSKTVPGVPPTSAAG